MRSNDRPIGTDESQVETTSRRSVLAGLGAMGVAGLAGCSGGNGGSGDGGDGTTTGTSESGGESYSMTIGSTYEPEHILVRAANRFKENIEAETSGRISVQITPGGSLGSSEDIIQAVQSDSIEGQVSGNIPVSMYAPNYYFVETPFVVQDWDHFNRVWKSDAFQPALEKIREEGNQRNLGVVYRGLRHYTSNKPVKSPDDVQGQNLRLPQLDDWVKAWEHIGASPTPVALDELYSALQQGVVDASEGPAQQVSSFSLSEVQSHYSLTSHMLQTGGLYVNETFLSELSDSDEELVETVAADATEWASQKAIDEEESLIEGLSENGMTIVRDVDTEAFREAGLPAVKELFENKYAASWEAIRDA